MFVASGVSVKDNRGAASIDVVGRVTGHVDRKGKEVGVNKMVFSVTRMLGGTIRGQSRKNVREFWRLTYTCLAMMTQHIIPCIIP